MTQGPQRLMEGKTYKFHPPMRATGFLGEGDETRSFPKMSFTTGRLVRIGVRSYEFRGLQDGKGYKFFAHAMLGGSYAAEVIEPNLRVVK